MRKFFPSSPPQGTTFIGNRAIHKNYIADFVIVDSGILDSNAVFVRKNLMPHVIEQVFINEKTANYSAPEELAVLLQ